MKPIKALIVEDEILIAETIKLYLEERGHSAVGIAISFEEAIEKIKDTEPDIILLDIRLYGQKSGIALANYLNELELKIPYIIVSSQYDSQIIKDAMEAGASGYVTKPIAKETLWASVELAVMKQAEDIANEKYVKLKVSNNTQRIKLKDICYLKSDHVYVEVVCHDTTYLCRYTLNELLIKINEPNFVQCNRSYIVNLNKIQKYSSSKIWIKEEEITVGSKYKEALAGLES